MKGSSLWWMVAVVVVVGTGLVTWRFAWFVAPLAWTGEAVALAVALDVTPGRCVVDVGAGDGAMAEAMAAIVGPQGRVHATEIAPARLAALAARKARGALSHMEIVAAKSDETGLADGGCDALYLRHVFHHLADAPTMARRLTRAVRPDGRIAIIDFPPGALWFHGPDHGVRVDEVGAAFTAAGWRLRERRDDWGGGTFLVVFERATAQAAAAKD